ncbi:MFS transporter [Enterococcus sp. BWB1-3]|uniref:MFS transporter n=1 Tax=unclassified Enterococcus TaxID=2608891 RepID=UPI0019225011|nr:MULTISPECIES: MFS transporter [unclassified Enterococcus]MBL1230781.1 MFS transporter [Enterococcus sp. BWB1-3]MCB5953214.1 MFS transporter [Enterococcus sp. BWT-B8]MCB5956238.1 MFS transporter [Enterococcus sp. CWB-B31]
MEIEQTRMYQTTFNFIKLVIGQAVSVFGTSLLRFALSLYVLDITGRADIFATLFAVSSLPVLLSPIAGAVADRFNRKTIMVGLDTANGLFSLLLLIAFLFNQTSLIVITIAMILFGFVGSMDTPVVTAIIPSLASQDKLESANGILQGVQSISGIVAPILGGLLYSIIGMDNILIITTVVFFLTAILESRILVPKNKSTYSGSIFRVLTNDLKEGVHYTLSDSFVRKTLLISVGLNLVLAPLFVVGIPYILRVTMNLSTELYGVGIGAIQFATILGALMIGAVLKKLKVKNFYLWILAIAILLIPITLSTTPMLLKIGNIPAFLLFVLCAVPLSACLSIVSIFSISKVQKITPTQHLAKVMSILLMIIQCASLIGQIIYGIGFEVFQDTVYIPIMITFFATFIIAIGSKFLYRNEKEV